MMNAPIPPELLAVFNWFKNEWALLVGGSSALFGLEKWRGQRLTNQKLRLENQKLGLELKALSLALKKEELDRVAREITGKPLPENPDPAAAFRVLLEEWAKDKATADINAHLDEIKARLEASLDALSEFSCPYCGAPLSERQSIPLDDEQKDWGLSESYECGYVTSEEMSRSLLRMAGSGGDESYSHATSTFVSAVRSAATSFGISR